MAEENQAGRPSVHAHLGFELLDLFFELRFFSGIQEGVCQAPPEAHQDHLFPVFITGVWFHVRFQFALGADSSVFSTSSFPIMPTRVPWSTTGRV